MDEKKGKEVESSSLLRWVNNITIGGTVALVGAVLTRRYLETQIYKELKTLYLQLFNVKGLFVINPPVASQRRCGLSQQLKYDDLIGKYVLLHYTLRHRREIESVYGKYKGAIDFGIVDPMGKVNKFVSHFQSLVAERKIDVDALLRVSNPQEKKHFKDIIDGKTELSNPFASSDS